LQRAAVLLDQELSADHLFATVDDALAIQYLTDIWGIQRQAEAVSSLAAGQLLANGQPILSTVDGAPILLRELPPDLQTRLAMSSADWIVVHEASSEPVEVVDAAALAPLRQDIGGEIELRAYGVAPAPQGAPVLGQPQEAIDLTFLWHLPNGTWPEGLALSVRPTSGGAFISDPAGEPGAIIQRDVAQPTLSALQHVSGIHGTLLDIQRLTFPASADGVFLIVYRQTDEGFENLAEIPLPVRSGTANQ
jgi:hypothetical protein